MERAVKLEYVHYQLTNRPMWNFNKLLGCPGFYVIKYHSDKNHISCYLKQRRKTADCPNCAIKTDQRYGTSSVRKLKHGTILGKVCILIIKPRRFRCRNCQKVFTETISFGGRYQRATLKHKKEVVFNLTDRSFLSGTRKYKVSYHTQRKWLKRIIKNEVFNFQKEEEENTPFVLGIDEVSFAGRDMVTTIGNISKHRLKGVLSSRRKDELKKVLKSLSPKIKSLISEVVIDMSNLYLKTVEETLPKAEIVVDHFHLIQDANRRIDEERRLVQDIYKKSIPRYILTKNKEDLIGQQIYYLADIMKHYPELRMFYLTKERLRDMYKTKTKEEAGEKLRLIISTLRSTDDGELILWGRTLSYWGEYILNYWNSRSTNGFMEGIHNKMKLVKRISFGFRNKEVFIHKVMLSVLITTLLLPQLLT
jgi:transposase